MAIRKIDEIIKIASHPLEKHFDIAGGSTEMVTTARKTELTKHAAYDDKDREIEEDYQMIMDAALDTADRIKAYIDDGVNAQFLTSLADASAQQLAVALNAAKQKAKLKYDSDIRVQKASTSRASKVVNNNLTVVMDRNEMLRHILAADSVIDAETLESNKEDQ